MQSPMTSQCKSYFCVQPNCSINRVFHDIADIKTQNDPHFNHKYIQLDYFLQNLILKKQLQEVEIEQKVEDFNKILRDFTDDINMLMEVKIQQSQQYSIKDLLEDETVPETDAIKQQMLLNIYNMKIDEVVELKNFGAEQEFYNICQRHIESHLNSHTLDDKKEKKLEIKKQFDIIEVAQKKPNFPLNLLTILNVVGIATACYFGFKYFNLKKCYKELQSAISAKAKWV